MIYAQVEDKLNATLSELDTAIKAAETKVKTDLGVTADILGASADYVATPNAEVHNKAKTIAQTLQESGADANLSEVINKQYTAIKDVVKDVNATVTAEQIKEKVEAIKQEAIKSLKSANIDAVVNDIKAIDIVDDNISAQLATAKAKLTDTNNTDEKAVKAIIEIAEVLNDEKITALVASRNGRVSLLNDVFINTFTEGTDDLLSLAENVTFAKGTDAINLMADKLKNASDTLGSCFINKDYTLAYDDQNITYDDALVLRGSVLTMVSALKYIASFDYGNVSYFNDEQSANVYWVNYDNIKNTPVYTLEKTEANGYDAITNPNPWVAFVANYTTAEIDPVTVLNQTNFHSFNTSAIARLEESKQALKSGAKLISDTNVSKVDVNNVMTITNAQKDDFEELQVEAKAIYTSLDAGTTYALDVSGMSDDEKTWHLDLSNMFDVAKAPSLSDFAGSYSYGCTRDVNNSIIKTEPTCADGSEAEIEVADAKAKSTKLFNVLTKIDLKDNTSKTGDALKNYLFD